MKSNLDGVRHWLLTVSKSEKYNLLNLSIQWTHNIPSFVPRKHNLLLQTWVDLIYFETNFETEDRFLCAYPDFYYPMKKLLKCLINEETYFTFSQALKEEGYESVSEFFRECIRKFLAERSQRYEN